MRTRAIVITGPFEDWELELFAKLMQESRDSFDVGAGMILWFLLGLATGLWVAANAWIWRYAVGYKAGVKYCLEQLEPVRIEIATLVDLSHVSEATRSRIRAAQEGHEETRRGIEQSKPDQTYSMAIDDVEGQGIAEAFDLVKRIFPKRDKPH